MSEWLAAARAVGVETASRFANEVDVGARFPAESFAALKARKLLGIMVPTSEGGPGAGVADVVSICHALGQYCASTAMIYAMHQIQVSCVVRHGGTSGWHRKFMKRLADEQLLLAWRPRRRGSAATCGPASAPSRRATAASRLPSRRA
jgi:acyl-CoA dehydrogenase